MWFRNLTGFAEESPEQVRANLHLQDNTLTSKVNGKTWICGSLETPTLKELRTKSGFKTLQGQFQLSELIGNVQTFHLDPKNEGALFQAASQFNLLEMVSPHVSPEEGIEIYEHDHTQGPACAIACGAGTMYRNYFAEVQGQIGQSKDQQIDCLYDLGIALGNEGSRLWKMQNGYAIIHSADCLEEIAHKLKNLNENEKDALREKLRIGLQWNTQVTPNGCTHVLSQAYCSALPVAYNAFPKHLWEDFAQLVLDASYEATLHAALLNSQKTGNNKVYLTFLGGGVFGNEEEWIFSAIKRALGIFIYTPLDVSLISYSSPYPYFNKLIK